VSKEMHSIGFYFSSFIEKKRKDKKVSESMNE